MKFGNTKDFKAVQYPFNWLAQYNDNTSLVEFKDGVIKNDFYAIEQWKLEKFGLVGNGLEFYFGDTGKFYLKDRPIEIYYKVNDVEYELTNCKDKDIISYKQAYSFFRGKTGAGLSGIESIHFGYKSILEFDDIQIYFSPIVALPMKGKAYFDIKLTSNKNLKGELIFKSNDKLVDSNLVELEINKKDNIQWIIK